MFLLLGLTLMHLLWGAPVPIRRPFSHLQVALSVLSVLFFPSPPLPPSAKFNFVLRSARREGKPGANSHRSHTLRSWTQSSNFFTAISNERSNLARTVTPRAPNWAVPVASHSQASLGTCLELPLSEEGLVCTQTSNRFAHCQNKQATGGRPLLVITTRCYSGGSRGYPRHDCSADEQARELNPRCRCYQAGRTPAFAFRHPANRSSPGPPATC